ncbi:hypothetical protein PGTUg99_034914 [Puccinia graminis f. sp. tritici]|uniref:Uncharacterized protein n=1 Tax=Puccinia graminis f. sp. tritici TaxID=56615 RepID=A0A5B0NLA6_PUCGR|nr:hypothetical protein PGTUg99_034914 [Puccinia graminis f. sp. tritici]
MQPAPPKDEQYGEPAQTTRASSAGRGVLKVSFFMRECNKSELVTRGDFRHFGAYLPSSLPLTTRCRTGIYDFMTLRRLIESFLI